MGGQPVSAEVSPKQLQVDWRMFSASTLPDRPCEIRLEQREARHPFLRHRAPTREPLPVIGIEQFKVFAQGMINFIIVGHGAARHRRAAQ